MDVHQNVPTYRIISSNTGIQTHSPNVRCLLLAADMTIDFQLSTLLRWYLISIFTELIQTSDRAQAETCFAYESKTRNGDIEYAVIYLFRTPKHIQSATAFFGLHFRIEAETRALLLTSVGRCTSHGGAWNSNHPTKHPMH